MNKNKFLLIALFFYLFINNLQAHNSQISVITLSKKESRWSILLSSSLEAFQYEVVREHPEIDFNKITEQDWMQLMIKHIEKSINIIANNNVKVSLVNGAIRPGHQTDMWFDLQEMPSILKNLSIQVNSFAGNPQHNCILLLPNQDDYTKFILGPANHHAIEMEVGKDQAFQQISAGNNRLPQDLAWVGLALLALGGLIWNEKIKLFINSMKVQVSKVNI